MICEDSTPPHVLLVTCLVDQHNGKALLEDLHVGVGRLGHLFTNEKGLTAHEKAV
ncbi:MAG: hypothetical protein ACRERE_28370 [Candidatus Entotheonellia bacterium]